MIDTFIDYMEQQIFSLHEYFRLNRVSWFQIHEEVEHFSTWVVQKVLSLTLKEKLCENSFIASTKILSYTLLSKGDLDGFVQKKVFF